MNRSRTKYKHVNEITLKIKIYTFITSFLCLGYPERSLYQVGIVEQKAKSEGSERSERFSR